MVRETCGDCWSNLVDGAGSTAVEVAITGWCGRGRRWLGFLEPSGLVVAELVAMRMVQSDDALENRVVAVMDYASDLTDAETDEEYAFIPRALERASPRRPKRTYGALLDGGGVSERRLRGRVDEQLELLRAVIPNSCTDGRASVLTGACEYIQKLQKQVQELHSELDAECCSDDDVSSCEVEFESSSFAEEERGVDSNCAFEWSCASPRGRSRSKVEVVSTRAGLRIRVECDRRPNLLADIMEVLEARSLIVEEAGIALEERFALDCIASVVKTQICRKRSSECRQVGARIKSLLADK